MFSQSLSWQRLFRNSRFRHSSRSKAQTLRSRSKSNLSLSPTSSLSLRQVNHSPSFTTDSKLDRDIKDALIYDTLLLLNLPSADKRRFVEEEKKRAKERLLYKSNKKDSKYREEQEDLAQQWQKEIEAWEDQHLGNYRRIYPGPDTATKYDQYFTQSATLYSETAASKARMEQAK